MATNDEMRDRLDGSMIVDEGNGVLVKCAHCNGDGWNAAHAHACCAKYSGLVDPFDANTRATCCVCKGSGFNRV